MLFFASSAYLCGNVAPQPTALVGSTLAQTFLPLVEVTMHQEQRGSHPKVRVPVKGVSEAFCQQCGMFVHTYTIHTRTQKSSRANIPVAS